MNEQLQLYRKRIIPDETVLLKDDVILYSDPSFIVAKWNTLKPRPDIFIGYCGYFLEKGFKINKIYDHNHQLVYWYCDIISHTFDPSTNSLIVTDLLVDIVVYGDNTLKVLDLDEVADALEQNLISVSDACLALKRANALLQEIYNNNFSKYQQIIDQYTKDLPVCNE